MPAVSQPWTRTHRVAGDRPPLSPATADLRAFLRSGWFPLAGAVFLCLLLPCAVQFQFLGFRVTGWAWLGGLSAAVVVFLTSRSGIRLPVRIWCPWLVLVAVYSLSGEDNAYQSAAQIVCPALVGLAASTLRPTSVAVPVVLDFLKWVTVAFLLVLVFLRVPMLLLGRLPEVTGMAPEAISSLLFQSVWLSAYVHRRQRADLVLYLACALVPVVAVTRGPMLGTVALLVLTLAPLRPIRRLMVILVALVAALLLFHHPRMQKKMFWSGEGTLADLRWDNPNLIKSGRDVMWEDLWRGVKQRPWLGHGGNADAAELLRCGHKLYLPHNDWLRILYNYGIIGCGLYVLAMTGQLLHGLRMTRTAPVGTRILASAALSAFIPYAVLMFTDNILIYAQFFGNPHFLLLGLAYGSAATVGSADRLTPGGPAQHQVTARSFKPAGRRGVILARGPARPRRTLASLPARRAGPK